MLESGERLNMIVFLTTFFAAVLILASLFAVGNTGLYSYADVIATAFAGHIFYSIVAILFILCIIVICAAILTGRTQRKEHTARKRRANPPFHSQQ